MLVTAIEAKPVAGAEADHKVDTVEGTRESRIDGDNVREYRRRVQRLDDDDPPRNPP